MSTLYVKTMIFLLICPFGYFTLKFVWNVHIIKMFKYKSSIINSWKTHYYIYITYLSTYIYCRLKIYQIHKSDIFFKPEEEEEEEWGKCISSSPFFDLTSGRKKIHIRTASTVWVIFQSTRRQCSILDDFTRALTARFKTQNKTHLFKKK